ncbi:hypothetical protein Mro03_13340 [Microbispora rosea subsp. rosea]|nr:hypothetical protein Mro03_13340 [Microbispora rosea subsp. rosea]
MGCRGRRRRPGRDHGHRRVAQAAAPGVEVDSDTALRPAVPALRPSETPKPRSSGANLVCSDFTTGNEFFPHRAL